MSERLQAGLNECRFWQTQGGQGRLVSLWKTGSEGRNGGPGPLHRACGSGAAGRWPVGSPGDWGGGVIALSNRWAAIPRQPV